MKNKSLLIILVSVLALTGCSKEVKPTEGEILKAHLALKDVADNDYPVIIDGYETTSFSKLTDVNKKGITYTKYLEIDFNKDGINEIMLDIDSKYDLYIILHYEDDHTYGYIMNKSRFEDIKEDGVYKYKSGSLEEYFRLSFQKEKYALVLQAVKNDENILYAIGPKETKKEEVEKYIKEFESKKSVEWIEKSKID